MILRFLNKNSKSSESTNEYNGHALRRQFGLGGVSPPSIELKPGEIPPPPPSIGGKKVEKVSD